MDPPLGSAVLSILAVAGVGLLVLAAYTYRRWDEPGVSAFAGALGLYGIAALTGAVTATTAEPMTATFWAYQGVQVASVVWLVFALQYTGRGPLVTRQAVGVVLGVLVLFTVPTFVVPGTSVGVVFAISGYLYGIILVILGTALVLQTTYRHGHLSLWVGVVFGLVAIQPWFVLILGFAVPEIGATWLYGVYAAGFLTCCLGALLAVVRLDAFTATAATGPVGRRAIMAETDDLMVVADDDGHVVEANDATKRAFGGKSDRVEGGRLSTLFGKDLSALQRAETVELATEDGLRQFDVQLVELTDQHDRPLGHLVSLRDVTDRLIRSQRLAVLNRVLRHNLRNKLTTIGGSARVLAEEYDSDYADGVVSAAADLEETSRAASEAETMLGREVSPSPIVVEEVLSEVVAKAARAAPDATVEIEVPEGLVVEVDEALFRVTLMNLVENAVEHNDGEEPHVEVAVTVDPDRDLPLSVAVADDGPGIPEQERAPLQSGGETPLEHGSGVGLWTANWAVTRLGGRIEFRSNDPQGTVVEFQLPVSVHEAPSGETATREAA